MDQDNPSLEQQIGQLSMELMEKLRASMDADRAIDPTIDHAILVVGARFQLEGEREGRGVYIATDISEMPYVHYGLLMHAANTVISGPTRIQRD